MKRWFLILPAVFLLTVLVCLVGGPASAGDFCNVGAEVDHQVEVNGESGQMTTSYGWLDTECPVLKVENTQNGTPRYRVRIASDNVRGLYSQTEHDQYLGRYPAPVEFDLYVPDAHVDKWQLLGFNPIPFSNIQNWEDPMWLGMTPTDTVAQWFVEMYFNTTDPEYRPWYLIEETPNQPSPTWTLYMTWQRLYDKIYFPVIVSD